MEASRSLPSSMAMAELYGPSLRDQGTSQDVHDGASDLSSVDTPVLGKVAWLPPKRRKLNASPEPQFAVRSPQSPVSCLSDSEPHTNACRCGKVLPSRMVTCQSCWYANAAAAFSLAALGTRRRGT